MTILHKIGRRLSNDNFNKDVGIGSNEHDFEFKDVISFFSSFSLTGRSSVKCGTASGRSSVLEDSDFSALAAFLRSCLILAIF